MSTARLLRKILEGLAPVQHRPVVEELHVARLEQHARHDVGVVGEGIERGDRAVGKIVVEVV